MSSFLRGDGHGKDELRGKYFDNLVFDSIDALEDRLELALHNSELDWQRIQSIVSWSWIIQACLNWKWNNSSEIACVGEDVAPS
jgi:hypothetical protein